MNEEDLKQAFYTALENFRCEACKNMRPHEKISVIKKTYHEVPGFTRNIKYCNDNEECFKIANSLYTIWNIK